jgi:hypothetical protein
MQKMTRATKEEMYRRFAYGESIERVAEEMQMEVQQVKYGYLHYFALPLSEKFNVTQLPELLTNRLHRLADDITDMRRIDALLSSADEKTLVSLLDMKRKIKERMMKELISSRDAAPNNTDAELDEQIAECYEKIMGAPVSG